MNKAADKPFLVSWEELHRDARVLAWRLLEQGPFERIVAIARGGLVPAAVVSRELEIRHVDTVCVASYDDSKALGRQGDLTVLKGVSGDGAGVLVVDDLVDSGLTAKLVREMLPKAHIATVYAKPQGRPLVDTFVTEVSQDTWIYFPWDLEAQPVQPIVLGLKPR